MEAKSSSVYSLIGLCQKAGKAISGGSMVEEAIRAGKAKLLIIAEDAGESMAKKFSDKANFYGVRMIYFGTQESLGQCIGKELRSAIVITDEGLSKAIEKKYQQHLGVNA